MTVPAMPEVGPGRTTFLGEWLTLRQAERALGVTWAELRELHKSGDVDVRAIRPGVWRVSNQSVQNLLSTSEWKARSGRGVGAGAVASDCPELGPVDSRPPRLLGNATGTARGPDEA